MIGLTLLMFFSRVGSVVIILSGVGPILWNGLEI